MTAFSFLTLVRAANAALQTRDLSRRGPVFLGQAFDEALARALLSIGRLESLAASGGRFADLEV